MIKLPTTLEHKLIIKQLFRTRSHRQEFGDKSLWIHCKNVASATRNKPTSKLTAGTPFTLSVQLPGAKNMTNVPTAKLDNLQKNLIEFFAGSAKKVRNG